MIHESGFFQFQGAQKWPLKADFSARDLGTDVPDSRWPPEFIIRLDHLGASSFIRRLFLNPDSYELMLRFFRAGSWSLPNHLADIFDFPQFFTQARLTLYGETKTARYFCEDFLWKPIDDVVRFVCVIDQDGRYNLMSSDLDLSPT